MNTTATTQATPKRPPLVIRLLWLVFGCIGEFLSDIPYRLSSLLGFLWDLVKNAVVNSFLMIGSIIYAIFQLFVFIIVLSLVVGLVGVIFTAFH